MNNTLPASRNQMRQYYRQQRRALTPDQQQQASEDALRQLLNVDLLAAGTRIAVYLASDGELDPHSIVRHCWQHEVEVYLPVLHPFCKGHLLFLAYQPHSQLVPNIYGIAEPRLDCRQVCPVRELDVILAPLVAFDSQGNRLGMGGGFYDRTLAPLRHDPDAIMVAGLAHNCQQAVELECQPWDVPLSQIITPKQVFSIK